MPTDSVVVSVRIRTKVKKELEESGIDVEDEVKDYINNRAAQIKLRKTIAKLTKIIEKDVRPSKKGFAESTIREDRYANH